MQTIEGFSKLSKWEKIQQLKSLALNEVTRADELLKSFWHASPEVQKTFDEFSENTISNFYIPYGVCPNVLINDQYYAVPMAIEESSVVAAASNACKYWSTRGGFKAEIISTTKNGQIHFIWHGESEKLFSFFDQCKHFLYQEVAPLTTNMEKRGGGLKDLFLVDRTADESGYYQLWMKFDTCDAMGANFINSCLETVAKRFEMLVAENDGFSDDERKLMIVMSILSNYTPECLVRVTAECRVDELTDPALGMSAQLFAEKIVRAVRIARIDTNRATTHNKGIFNGIDAVVVATGNDYRAVEACGHAYAARDGIYRGLTQAEVSNDLFKFWLEIPIAVGTVGGLTRLHPLADLSLSMMGRPNAKQLMMIIATIGLAQNFAALRSLVTSGIQKGHMKMHLMNILKSFEATEAEQVQAKNHFSDKVVSVLAVRNFLTQLRGM